MGQFLSSELDWVYDPNEGRWRLGLGSIPPNHKDSDDDTDDDDSDYDNNLEQNSGDDGDGENRKTRNKKPIPFSFQHSVKNERSLSLLYFSLLQSFCSASGVSFNEDRSSAAALMKRQFERPLKFSTHSETVPMSDVEGGLGAVEPKTAASTFLIARNFAPAFSELEGEDDETAAFLAGTGTINTGNQGRIGGGASSGISAMIGSVSSPTTSGGGRTSGGRQTLEQTRERAVYRRQALMDIQNAATTLYTSQDATKFSPFHHYLEISDASGRCCFARLSESGAVVFDNLESKQHQKNSSSSASASAANAASSTSSFSSMKNENEISGLKSPTSLSFGDNINNSSFASRNPQQPDITTEAEATNSVVKPYTSFGLSIIKHSMVQSLNLEQTKKEQQELEKLEKQQKEKKEKRKLEAMKENEKLMMDDQDQQQQEKKDEKEDEKEKEVEEHANENENENDEGGEIPDDNNKNNNANSDNKNDEKQSNNKENNNDNNKVGDDDGESVELKQQQQQQQKLQPQKSLDYSPSKQIQSVYGGAQSFFGFDEIKSGEEAEQNNNKNGEDQEEENDDNKRERKVTMLALPAENDEEKNKSSSSTKTEEQLKAAKLLEAKNEENLRLQQLFGANQVTCHSLHHFMAYLALVASAAASEEVEFALEGGEGDTDGDIIKRCLWEYVQQSPGFIFQQQQQQQQSQFSPKSSRRSQNFGSPTSPSSSSRNKNFTSPTSPGSSGRMNSPFSSRTPQNNPNNSALASRTINFSRQPVFALRSLISRCGMTLFPPRGTAEARRLVTAEETELFFTAVGSQMTVEVCSRLMMFQNIFSPLLSVSFERACEGDMDVSRFSSKIHKLQKESNSSQTSSTTTNLLQKILKAGVKSRISNSASEAAIKAIFGGRLVSAVAESEVAGVCLVASGSTLEVVHSSPRTLLAVTRELSHVLEQLLRHCPPTIQPGEFLLRELLDTCFFNNLPLVDKLIGGVHTAKARSILGSRHDAGSVYRLLFNLTEHVPLPESTSRTARRRPGIDDGTLASVASQNSSLEKQGGGGAPTMEQLLRQSISESPCRRYRYLLNQQHQQQQQQSQQKQKAQQVFSGGDLHAAKSDPSQAKSSLQIGWKEENMVKSPSDYVNDSLKKVVAKTTATSDAILNKIKEVSHVLKASKKHKQSSSKSNKNAKQLSVSDLQHESASAVFGNNASSGFASAQNDESFRMYYGGPSSSGSYVLTAKNKSDKSSSKKKQTSTFFGAVDEKFQDDFGEGPFQEDFDDEQTSSSSSSNDENNDKKSFSDEEDEEYEYYSDDEEEEEQDDEQTPNIPKTRRNTKIPGDINNNNSSGNNNKKRRKKKKKITTMKNDDQNQNRDDPDEIAALFRASSAGTTLISDSNNNADADASNNISDSKYHSHSHSQQLSSWRKQHERQLFEWERTVSLLQTQARLITRISPHPVLSTHPGATNSVADKFSRNISGGNSNQINMMNSSFTSDTPGSPIITQLFGSPHPAKSQQQSQSPFASSYNQTAAAIAETDRIYSVAETLGFAKQLLFFVAALREVDTDLVSHLQLMRLRNRAIHAAPPSSKQLGPQNPQRHERILAEMELLKAFCNHLGANQSQPTFEGATLPTPCAESSRIGNVEIHIPTVIAAFGSARVRPLGEIHFTIRDRLSEREQQEMLLNISNKNNTTSTTSSNLNRTPSFSSSPLKSSGSSSISASNYQQHHHQQHVRACVYSNGVLLYPDNAKQISSASAPSLQNALAAVDTASMNRSQLVASSHESTLLPSGSSSKFGGSSSASSGLDFSSANGNRAPNRITADNLILMGATHYSSIHELLVNLLPEGYHTWDFLFNGTRVNTVLEKKFGKKYITSSSPSRGGEKRDENIASSVVASPLKKLLQFQQHLHQQQAVSPSSPVPSTTTMMVTPGRPTTPPLPFSSSSTSTSLMATPPSASPSSSKFSSSARFRSGLSNSSKANHQQQQQQQGDSSLLLSSTSQTQVGDVVLCDSVPDASLNRQLVVRDQLLELERENEESQRIHREHQERERIRMQQQRAAQLEHELRYGTKYNKHKQQILASPSSTEKEKRSGSAGGGKLSSSSRHTPRPPSSSIAHGGRDTDTFGETSSVSSHGDGTRTSSIAGTEVSRRDTFLPKPISLLDYAPTQIHNSSMMAVLLAPRLHGEPILRCIAPPLFSDATSSLRAHAEFLARTLLKDSHSSSSSSQQQQQFSGGGGTTQTASFDPSTSINPASSINPAIAVQNSRAQQQNQQNLQYQPGKSLTTITSSTESNFAWCLGNRWYISSDTQSSPILAMLQSTLLHRPVLRGLAGLSSDATSVANVRRGSVAPNVSANSASVASSSAVPLHTLQDQTVWDKIFKFLDPPKYGTAISTPPRLLYGLALLRDLVHALDGFLQSLAIDNRPIFEQHDVLEQHSYVFTQLEKNFARSMGNAIRIACIGTTTHRVFSRALAALSAYIAVTSAHFSRLSLWPSSSQSQAQTPSQQQASQYQSSSQQQQQQQQQDQMHPCGAEATSLHRLLWLGLSFIDVRGLLTAVSARCTAVLGVLIDYNATEDDEVLVISMNDGSTSASSSDKMNDSASQQHRSYQQQDPNDENNNLNTNDSNNNPILTPAEILTEDARSNPEFLESLKISGAHETAALVVTCGVQLIAVTSSASSDIARRWIHGNMTSSSSFSSSSSSSATIFFLDQVLATSLSELRIAFHFATIAWRALCLLGTPSSSTFGSSSSSGSPSSPLSPNISSASGGPSNTSSSGNTNNNLIVQASPYAEYNVGNTVSSWNLPLSVVKSVASHVVAHLTMSATSILPDPTVSSLLSLVAVIHRIAPSPGPMFSLLRLDKALVVLWEFLTVRRQQISQQNQSGRIGRVVQQKSSDKNQEQNAAPDHELHVKTSISLEEMMRSFGFLTKTGSKQKKELMQAAELASEIAESELFFALSWVTAVAEDSLAVPINISPWVLGMLEYAAGTCIIPCVEKHCLPWTSANPFSKIVSIPRLPGACSVFHLSLMRSFMRWISEPSSNFVGVVRFGAPFSLQMWTSIVEKMIPTMLLPRFEYLQQQLAGTSLLSGGQRLLIHSFEVYVQFCFKLLMLLADGRDSACESLLIDAGVDLDRKILMPLVNMDQIAENNNQQQQQQSSTSPLLSSSESSSKKSKKRSTTQQNISSSNIDVDGIQQQQQQHKLLQPVTDVKEAFPILSNNAKTVFAQLHAVLMSISNNATSSGNSSANSFSVAATPNFDIKNALFSNPVSKHNNNQTTTGSSSSSRSQISQLQQFCQTYPTLLTQAFSDVVSIASSFSALVPALDLLLLPHAMKQLLSVYDIASFNASNNQNLNQNNPMNLATTSNSSSGTFLGSASSLQQQQQHGSSADLGKSLQRQLSNIFEAPSEKSIRAAEQGNSLQQQSGSFNSNNNNSSSSPTSTSPINLATWGANRIKILSENAAALFPDILYVVPEKARLSATLQGCLECVTSFRTLARIVQVSSIHFAADLKRRYLIDGYLFPNNNQNNRNNSPTTMNPSSGSGGSSSNFPSSTQFSQALFEDPSSSSSAQNQNNNNNNNNTNNNNLQFLPEWAKSLPVIMSLLESVISPGSLNILRSSRGSAHLLVEIELSLLALAAHASMMINNFSHIAPALSFFLVRYAQPKNLLMSDTDLNAHSSRISSLNKRSNSENDANSAEVLEVLQQHRSLRTALLGVIDAILQRSSLIIAEMSIVMGNQNNISDDAEAAAATAEIQLTQPVRELIGNGTVALAQYILIPSETRSRSFKFAKLPISCYLSSTFSGCSVTAANNSAMVSSRSGNGVTFLPGGGSYYDCATKMFYHQQSQSSQQQQSSSSFGKSSSGMGSSPFMKEKATTNANSSSSSSTSLVASIPQVEMLAGKNYDTDRTTAICFLQRILILSRRLNMSGAMLQEFARRNISATMLAILDYFNSKKPKIGSSSGQQQQQQQQPENSSFAGATAAAASAGGNETSSPSASSLSSSSDSTRISLELAADALLSTIHHFSNEVLHAGPKSASRSIRR